MKGCQGSFLLQCLVWGGLPPEHSFRIVLQGLFFYSKNRKDGEGRENFYTGIYFRSVSYKGDFGRGEKRQRISGGT